MASIKEVAEEEKLYPILQPSIKRKIDKEVIMFTEPVRMCGGYGPTENATHYIQLLVNEIKPLIEEHLFGLRLRFPPITIAAKATTTTDVDVDVDADADTDADADVDSSSSKYTFEAIKYKQQVVKGMNYIVKVKYSSNTTTNNNTDDNGNGNNNNDYLHLKIYQPLPHDGENLRLVSCTRGYTLECSL